MMAAKPRYATKAAIARLVQSVRDAGIDVDSRTIEASPDGTVRFEPAKLSAATASNFDSWEAKL